MPALLALVAAQAEQITDVGRMLGEISAWIDNAPANAGRDPEARTWGRVAKVGEEFGEAISALIGATGQNPRKGQYGCMADVVEELLDVALTALAAVEHFQGNDGRSTVPMFADHVRGVYERAGLGGPDAALDGPSGD